ncbi:polynucleotide 5'-hydroxyl-kinase NOL9 isoform X2 [Patella vulgata]|nr:polynucleotide 5'-hydroxyl-kinase NOL9 isoform X2 [Patella vulgata]XP_050397236.1 polynucleotide 5'-hydroxyl-kinase NOL9 isoform X2 [Patella vulgata]XP_050397237.1 polynucleotide 5'-hydroxyl-kinase NOL9 isoform X2 [Patella vulgata]
MGKAVGRKSTRKLPTVSRIQKTRKQSNTKIVKKPTSNSKVEVIDFSVLPRTNVQKLNAFKSKISVFRNFVDSGEESSEFKNDTTSQKLLENNNTFSFLSKKLSEHRNKQLLENACKTEIIVVETDVNKMKVPSNCDNDLSKSVNANCDDVDDDYEPSMDVHMSYENLELSDNENTQNGYTCVGNVNKPEFVLSRKGHRSVLILTHPAELCFKGKAKVRSLLGSCKILGYEIKPGNNSVDVFSPNSNSFLTIKTVRGEPKNTVANVVTADMLNESSLNQLLADLNELANGDCVVLILDRLISPINFESSTVPQFKNLFHLDDPQAKYSLSSMSDCNSLWVSASREYDTAIYEWTNKIINGIKPVVMVVGGKNSGKSTLNRMLINSALNVSNAVSFLDCDVGQAEFTPSGIISLHHINEPALGPPFTHQKNSDHMCFYGEINPSKGLTRYIKSVEIVHRSYRNLDTKLPVIVNTLGWNEGLGLKIIVDLIHMIKPTMIVQLDCEYDYNNFPPLTSDYLMNTPGWLYNIPELMINSGTPPSNFDNQTLYIMDSEVPTKYRFPFKAEQYRELAILAYLNSTLDNGTKLLHMEPYKINFKDVVIHDCQHPGDNSQILYAFNASVVGLCEINMTTSYVKKESGLHFVKEMPVCPSYGLGIIRAIDIKNEHIYLVTPLPFEKLLNVNCLIKGAVHLPIDILSQQTESIDVSELPYLGSINKTVGSTSLINRSKMPRKQYLQKGNSSTQKIPKL